jgi:hypothetical protein
MRMSHAIAAPHFLQIDDSLPHPPGVLSICQTIGARRYMGTSSFGRKQLLA